MVEEQPTSKNQEIVLNEANLAVIAVYCDLLYEDQQILAADKQGRVNTRVMESLQQLEPDIDLAQWARTLHSNMEKLLEALQRGETVVFSNDGGDGVSYTSESVHEGFTNSELGSFVNFLFPTGESTPKNNPNYLMRQKFDKIQDGIGVSLSFSGS